MGNMKMSDKGLKFLAHEEGEKLTAYQDQVGVWTISVGVTTYPNGKAVKQGDKLTQIESTILFKTTLKRFEARINKAITRDINQNQFDALVSLCYNIGEAAFATSTLVKKVNANPCDKEQIEKWLLAWRFAGGEPILLGRRKREVNLYFS